ncbi:hypothetical protein HBI56_156110 [Parastagonospora nodorum]|nr:hypothetical protein HBH53_070680 [Parastagonospora nodorum]KAH3973804.1 hypothetical protein HBH52_141140 [Parastagonospora nodorum]KAH4044506.1 hypothetical protein HBH49_215580 [Parastagonospora nodorum]KAH4072322.1 hypothetical protein HBH50_058240 [Parastagonospora nodorum]KAH4089009.1 hypothetical protein HBH48_121680 [Parastagonospora nodorum]
MQKTLSALPLSTSRGSPIYLPTCRSRTHDLFKHAVSTTRTRLSVRCAQRKPHLAHGSFGSRLSRCPSPIPPTNAAFLSETRGGLQLRHGAPSNSAFADERVRRAFPLVDCRVGPGI